MENYYDADPADLGRFWSWGFDLLFMVESAMYMHRDGFQNKASYNRFIQAVASLTNTTGGRQWWPEAQHIWGADAVAELEEWMNEISDQVPPWNELRPEFKRYTEQLERAEREAL